MDGVHRLVDSGGPLARSSERFKNFGLKGRGTRIFLETKSVGTSRMPFPFPRLRILRTIAPAAGIKADCAGRQAMRPNQFRDGECGAPTRSLIVRVCAAVVLAACLVSGLATGIRDAAAVVTSVDWLRDLDFGDVASDADLAGTVVVSPAGAKTVTGGVIDFGGTSHAARFRVNGTASTSYSCTLPGSFLEHFKVAKNRRI